MAFQLFRLSALINGLLVYSVHVAFEKRSYYFRLIVIIMHQISLVVLHKVIILLFCDLRKPTDIITMWKFFARVGVEDSQCFNRRPISFLFRTLYNCVRLPVLSWNRLSIEVLIRMQIFSRLLSLVYTPVYFFIFMGIVRIIILLVDYCLEARSLQYLQTLVERGLLVYYLLMLAVVNGFR